MRKISILGCGWLGFPLASALLKEGFQIKGSTTTPEKLPTLKNAGIEPYLIDIPVDLEANSIKSEKFSTAVQEFLIGSDTLIINIPPKLRGAGTDQVEKSYVKKIAALIPDIVNSSIKNILFISSTSVYNENQQNVTESTKPQPETESGKQLIEVEALLQNNNHFKTTILRFGGLIGENRQPGKYLAGKENLGNPDAPVNLIHQEDCIGIILKIVKINCWNEVLNAVSPFHPTRENYYTQKAKELNLAMPRFNYSKPSTGKIIENDKVVKLLRYTFAQPNL